MTSDDQKGQPRCPTRRATCLKTGSWAFLQRAPRGLQPIVAPRWNSTSSHPQHRTRPRDRAADGPLREARRRAAGLFDVGGRRITARSFRRHLRLRPRPWASRSTASCREGGRGPDRAEPAPRRFFPSGLADSRCSSCKRNDPRGRAAPRLLRHLHGQAHRGRAGIGHATSTIR